MKRDDGFLIGHSVPSTITLVVVNLALKPSGAKKCTTSQSGHRDTSIQYNDMYKNVVYI